MNQATKHERAKLASQFLEDVSRQGRKFFTHKGRVSRFEVDARGTHRPDSDADVAVLHPKTVYRNNPAMLALTQLMNYLLFIVASLVVFGSAGCVQAPVAQPDTRNSLTSGQVSLTYEKPSARPEYEYVQRSDQDFLPLKETTMIVSDEPNWMLKAMEALDDDHVYSRLKDMNGLPLLPVVAPNNSVLVGHARYDAANTDNPLQRVAFPWVVFTAKYPDFKFTPRGTTRHQSSGATSRYQAIFGTPQSFTSYYIRVHREAEQLQFYHQLISEVLVHGWISGAMPSPTSPGLSRRIAQNLIPFFSGAPENLRDFYTQEGAPFLDWLLKNGYSD